MWTVELKTKMKILKILGKIGQTSAHLGRAGFAVKRFLLVYVKHKHTYQYLIKLRGHLALGGGRESERGR